MVSTGEIIKETRNARKHVDNFVDQIINFVKENIVDNDDRQKREEEWQKLKAWLNRNLRL